MPSLMCLALICSVGDVLNALADVSGFNVFCGGCIECSR